MEVRKLSVIRGFNMIISLMKKYDFYIIETTDAITEPEVATIEVQILPAPDPNDPFNIPPPLEDDDEPDDPFQLGNDHDDDNEGPAAMTTEPIAPPKSKKRKVTHQDIQAMQLEVLKVEKQKINLEVETLMLIKEKLKLEIEHLKVKSSHVNQ